MPVRVHLQAIIPDDVATKVEDLISQFDYTLNKTKVGDAVSIPQNESPPANFEAHRLKRIGQKMMMGTLPDYIDVMFFIDHNIDEAFWKRIPKRVKNYIDQVIDMDLTKVESSLEDDILDGDEGA